jgi:hypothetical protein
MLAFEVSEGDFRSLTSDREFDLAVQEYLAASFVLDACESKGVFSPFGQRIRPYPEDICFDASSLGLLPFAVMDELIL